MKIPFEDVSKLEKILYRLDHISKEKENEIIKDMKWLAEKLKDAWIKLEKLNENNNC